MQSHEKELRKLCDDAIKLLYLNKDDCVIEYWEEEDSLLLATFEYNVIVRRQEDNYLLEVSFFVNVHPNISAHTVLKLSELNSEIQLLDSYDYDDDGNIIFQNDVEFETDDKDATVH